METLFINEPQKKEIALNISGPINSLNIYYNWGFMKKHSTNLYIYDGGKR